jgi:lysophospholipase L1-like esterase
VLVLGDSLVLSVQVPLTQTFCKGLERRLASADPTHRWRVINGGVQGYGPVEEWLFYRDVAEALQPDIVLMVPFVGNDAIEAYDKETWLTLGHPPAGRSVDATANLVRRTIRRSAVLQVARVRVDQLRSHFATPGIERPLMTYLANPPVDVTHGLEVARQAFGLIAARAEAGGARAALALMPARFQVDDAGYEQMAAAARLGGHELARNAGTERFEAALAPLELPTLDLLPVLASQPHRSGLFFQRNVHLTPRGHDVVAEALFRFLVDHRLTFRPSL